MSVSGYSQDSFVGRGQSSLHEPGRKESNTSYSSEPKAELSLVTGEFWGE